MAAAQAEAPDLADLLSNPRPQTRLQQFLTAPGDQRPQQIQQLDADPEWQSLTGTPEGQRAIQQVPHVANTCQNYPA